MEKLIIQSNEDTPQIEFDPATYTLELSGKSYPDNVFSFYEPVLAWINDYAACPGPLTNLVFKLDYFNTATAKIIFDILSLVDTIRIKGHEVRIIWYYKQNDDDMKEAGEGYEKIIETKIELISC